MSAVTVTFHGVRGSTPCSSPDLCGYGGNTSCVVIENEGDAPIILDLGTGLRWDHVQGLPFFAPIHRPGNRFAIYGPPEPDLDFGTVLGNFMKPPYFPVCCGDLIGDVSLHDAWNESFASGSATITARSVPHTGVTNGYRIDVGGVSVAYVSDHQQPLDDAKRVHENVLELCADVDLLIHDAQYTPEQFAMRSDWGHCTMEYACEVAVQSGAKTLAMFHHDPDHTDVRMDALVEETKAMGERMGVPEAAYIHPEAVIIGNVTIGAESSVWPCAVLRGDDGSITVGARTSVQDGAVLHTTAATPTSVGDDCTIGHLAHLEGCTIENGSLVGTASVVLHRAVVGPGSLVAANAVVLNGQVIPPGALAMGVPAKIREGAADADHLRLSAQSYVTRAAHFRDNLRRID